MIQIVDFKASLDGDIVIYNNNIQIELDSYKNTLLVAQRRICARLDDYPSYSSAAAGLEQYLFQSGIIKYSEEIKASISRCLNRDGVLSQANLGIDIIDTKTTTAKLLVHFIFPFEDKNTNFRVFVDHQNQRILQNFS